MATFTAAAHQDEPLDALLWRVMGATTWLEVVYDLNPGLADLGPFLPHGHIVTLPLLTQAPVEARKIVQLWD
jgi:phage tail protein X